MLRLSLGMALFLAVGTLKADEEAPQRKPVPAMQVLPLPRSEAAVERNGRELSRYVFDAGLKRPFVYPVIGPSGRSLTRMGHPRDPNSHSHHNSVWISHNSVDGVDFWADSGGGRIVQRRVIQYEDADDEAIIQTENDWIDAEGRVLLKEYRSLRFRSSPDEAAAGSWLLVIDLELHCPAGKAKTTLGKTPFGFLGVRMAKTIGVHDGGGTIRNSEGGVNEKDIFWKPARWVDYSGAITPTAVEGITLMDHPQNAGHPNAYHVRDDGWMGASATFAEDREIVADQPWKLRYGLWVHGALDSVNPIEAAFKTFAEIGDPPPRK